MYNLRITNLRSFCTCARFSLLDACKESPFFSVKEEGKNLVLLGFDRVADAEEMRDLIKNFLKNFCFFCVGCERDVKFKIQKEK